MVNRVEIFRENRGIVVLQSLKVLNLFKIPNRFYESPKFGSFDCELCKFLQIWLHILNYPDNLTTLVITTS